MICCVLPDMFFILIMEMVDSDLLCLTRHVFYLDYGDGGQ